MIRKFLVALGYLIIRMDIPILAPSGTNILGLGLAFVAFLPLGVLMRKFGTRMEGVLNFMGGLMVFGVDWIYRRKLYIILETEKGGKLFYLPSWIWGVVWMISGVITIAIELIKG